jgi:ferric-dicitrate binding protein FerR (iron transport regulator)
MIKDRIWTLVSRKLTGEATASELAELNEILQSKPGNDLYLQAIYEYWNSPEEKDEEFLEATYHLHQERLKAQGFDLEAEKDKDEPAALFLDYPETEPNRPSRRKLYTATALFCVLALGLFFLYKITGNKVVIAEAKRAPSEVSTKNGSRTKIILPDGSSVWLNGSSKLVYDNKNFGEKLREVTLSGEAYFDVVKNAGKPFIIHTNKMDIKVLGTAFNVKAYPGEKHTETSLIRGSIEVTLKDRRGTYMMKPNDKLVLRNDAVLLPDLSAPGKKFPVTTESPVSLTHLTVSEDDHSILETAWVENKLEFDNESFENVAVKMERWYGVIIRFADTKPKGFHMTGNFEKETVTEALDALRLIYTFKYSIKNDTITIAK